MTPRPDMFCGDLMELLEPVSNCPECGAAECFRQGTRVVWECCSSGLWQQNGILILESQTKFCRRVRLVKDGEPLRVENQQPKMQLGQLQADHEGPRCDGAVRESVRWFAERMEAKLRDNDHKTHWTLCNPEFLFDRLTDEAWELCEAMSDFPEGSWHLTNEERDCIISEAADVANFAMMIADKARAAEAVGGE